MLESRQPVLFQRVAFPFASFTRDVLGFCPNLFLNRPVPFTSDFSGGFCFRAQMSASPQTLLE